MPATSKQRTTARHIGSALGDYARSGHALHMVGDVHVIHAGTVEEDGDTFVTSLLVELAGQPAKLGIVQIASAARDRWKVSDGDGWLDAEFGTMQAAVKALHSAKTRQRMQERAKLRRELADLQHRIDVLPAIKGEIVDDESVRCTATDPFGHDFEHEPARSDEGGYDEWERCGRPANDPIHTNA